MTTVFPGTALSVRREGQCTRPRPNGKDPKVRFPTSEDAAMGLIEARERFLTLGRDRVPIRWYACSWCRGFHLTCSRHR